MLIDRPALLARLRAYRNTDQVKVLVGVRRCGKSTLLDMFRQELVSGGVELRNVFVKRLDGFDVPIGYSAEDLHSELQAAMDVSDSTLPFYVFLDEVQDVSGWELVVRRLQSRANTDVYITGSSCCPENYPLILPEDSWRSLYIRCRSVSLREWTAIGTFPRTLCSLSICGMGVCLD